MKSMFIMSVAGPDSLGIIKALAHTTRGLGGEWLTSKAIKLDGRFTAMMKVTIEEERESELRSKLAEEHPELHFSYDPVVISKDEASEVINLVVDCKDRPGLTKDISSVLSNLSLHVENMEFNRCHVSSIGEAVFSAKLAISVPEGTSSEAVADEIEALSEDIRVNVV